MPFPAAAGRSERALITESEPGPPATRPGVDDANNGRVVRTAPTGRRRPSTPSSRAGVPTVDTYADDGYFPSRLALFNLFDHCPNSSNGGMVNRRRALTGLAMIGCLAASLPVPVASANPEPAVATPASSRSFSIEHVRSIDNKTIDVAFDQTIGTELQNMVVAVPNALLRYVRISGGSGGQSDALLDGRFLSTAVATAQVVATADKDTLRIVFTGTGDNAVTLQGGAKYELWLDASNNAPTALSTPWSTTLTTASAAGATNVKVTSVANLAVGQAITIDTGETRTITGPTEAHGLFNGTAGDTGTGVDLS